MGLMDILNGMQHGPRGQRQPTSGSGGGMSPLTMALLGLLAYKAMKHFGGSQAAPAGAGRAAPPAGTTPAGAPSTGASGGLGDLLGGLFGGRAGSLPASASPGGDLGEVLRGGLGGLVGGAAAGSVLKGGLDQLVKELHNSGHGKQVQSWVGTGSNQEIAPGDLANALGGDTIDTLSQQTGMQRDDLLASLSRNLPELIDQLTPQGRLPTEEEAHRMV